MIKDFSRRGLLLLPAESAVSCRVEAEASAESGTAL